MALTRADKEKIREDMGARFNAAKAAIVTEYRGLTVTELTELRLLLRKSDAKLTVVKNRIVKKAFENEAKDSAPMADNFKGPVAVAFINGDPAQASKTLLDFQKEHPNLVIKGGLVDSKAVSLDDLTAIASLPSREELLAKIVGSIIAPHRGLVTVLMGVPRNVVQVINAIKEKKA